MIWQSEAFKGQNNRSAQVLWNFVHLLAVLYKKKQREITKICVVWERKPRRKIIEISIWNSTLLSYVVSWNIAP